nr:hypothetical protein [Tanacetum cinerariifolium]
MNSTQQNNLCTLRLTHISQASGSGADEGTGTLPGVPDVPIDESKEEISWNLADEEGDDDEGKDDAYTLNSTIWGTPPQSVTTDPRHVSGFTTRADMCMR